MLQSLSAHKAIDTNMTEWLRLERLPDNDLPLPKYETANSAGVDFPACLTRIQRLVPEGARYDSTKPFVQLRNGDRYFADNIDDVDKSNQLIINPKETIMVSLGYKCEFGKAYVLLLHIRSSIGMMGLELANSTGIIDPDYRGELWAVIYNRNENTPIQINHGDRLVQGVMLGFNQAIIEQGDVCNTSRGEGGFGSTGVKIT